MGESTRTERDSMGEIQVPSDRLWGAQTQRSLENFRIGNEKMPMEIIRAMVQTKWACALANRDLARIDAQKAESIESACRKILSGDLDGEFPLSVWQTGSGTQSNMNANEVISHLAAMEGTVLHANDDVNRSQSTNDVFPTAMHLATLKALEPLVEACRRLQAVFGDLAERYSKVIKIGRTHLQDATPITAGQEVGAWAGIIGTDLGMVSSAAQTLLAVPLGGTAVGTGLNAGSEFTAKAIGYLGEIASLPLVGAANRFSSMSAKSEMAFVHGALRTLAADLMKIANDIRSLASGPRAGIGELRIPENEPGSSIMPGKVNPTQCEALAMVCIQVMGNDVAIAFAASQGAYQLNVFMPVIARNMLHSILTLTDALVSFTDNCAIGIEVDEEKCALNLSRSLMTVTALTPIIGYDAAASIAKTAHAQNTDLKSAAIGLGFLTESEFDAAMDFEKMTREE